MKKTLQHYILNISIAFCLLILVVYNYRFLFHSFFQQDEWYTLGQALSGGIFSGLTQYSPPFYAAGYIRFLGTFLNNFFHYHFPINPLPFVLFGLFFHWVNSVMVYYFSFLLTKKKTVGIIAAIYFSISTVHSQAISWFASTTTTLPSLTFALIALCFSLLSVSQKKSGFLILAQFFMVISFLFKESSSVLFFLLPMLYFISSGVSLRNLWKTILLHIPTIIYAIYVIFIRFYILFTPQGKVGIFVTKGDSGVISLLRNLIIYPFIGFSQTFIPYEFLFQFSKSMVKSFSQFSIPYNMNSTEYQKIILFSDGLSVILSIVLIGAVLNFLFRRKDRKEEILLPALLILINFVPISVLHRDNTSYFESRYYYPASVGAGILLSIFINSITSFGFRRKKVVHIFITICGIAFVMGYFYKNISLTRARLLQENIEASERKTILTTIKRFFPNVPKNSTFLIDGDSLGYYGIPGQKIPFQEGIGYTLMVLFFDQGVIPGELLQQEFLWNVQEQGFRQIEGNGFGYFYSLSALKSALEKNPLISPDRVYAVFWNSTTKTLEDTTQSVRKQLFDEGIK